MNHLLMFPPCPVLKLCPGRKLSNIVMSPPGHHLSQTFSIRPSPGYDPDLDPQTVAIKYLKIIKSQLLIVGRAQSSGIFMVIFIIFDWLSRLRIFVKL